MARSAAQLCWPLVYRAPGCSLPAVRSLKRFIDGHDVIEHAFASLSEAVGRWLTEAVFIHMT
ncbi:hypothetical protein ACE103_17645 [Bradyrhizobium sp. ma5]|uniref:hypothetical protein n=1 Tax=Bradyrhizobium sp. ma5 TaxID=3344828 RepID=UPI0035D4295F